MSGGEALITMLTLGNYVIGIFSVIFLFYTNSFLIKRRKKEFGLFNVLGMEKKHVAKVISLETFFASALSLLLGLTSGIVLSKLMFLLLSNILQFNIPFTYFVSVLSIGSSVLLFSGIFILILLNNLRHIHLAKPIELLRGGQVGEREPKTKWLLVVIGLITLGYGYYIALVTESPLTAMVKFFLAVVLVIIGTYALFTAGTIALLKLLRKNKKFYYQTKHFISVSGMIYRMKQNAAGLASICILSTMVLIMLSTTVSLYIGMEDLLKYRYPKEISVSGFDVSQEEAESIEKNIVEEADKHKVEMIDPIHYRSVAFPATQQGNSFNLEEPETPSFNDVSVIEAIPLNEYNQLEKQSATLDDDEVLLYTFRGDPIKDTITIDNQEFKIKDHLQDLTFDGKSIAMLTDRYFVVMKDESIIHQISPNENLSYYYGFDTEADSETEIALTLSLSQLLKEQSVEGYAEGKEEARESFYSLYGGLFFLGIFLGALFIMATVLIMYYKQISEGYDDKKRFEIMQNVGLSKEEIKKSIHSQVLIVFFLPLVGAVIHIAFAFKVITKLLALLNMTNVSLFVLWTVITVFVFAVFYAIVYLLTAREYYKIVS